MTRRASPKQSDLQRIFRAAKAVGSTVQIDPNTMQMTVFPFAAPEAQVMRAIFPETRANDWSDEIVLARLEDREPAPSPVGKGGYPIPSDDPKDPLRKWYAQIGFDPATMDEKDMGRLMDAAEARWRAQIPNEPMTKREKTALSDMAEHGVGVEVSSQLVKGCGPDTQDRLEARGFIRVCMQEKFPDRIRGYVLTDAGHQAALKLTPTR